MQFKYLDFLKKLLIFTIILAVAGYFLTYVLPEKFISPILPALFVFFFCATGTIHYILLRISIKRPNSFINYFMLLTFGKLIFYLTLILVYALINRDNAVSFILSFAALYLFFTAFEVSQSLAHAKVNEGE
jgi:Na+/melibiose symporter-like transporter